jgi:hypothetical protein
MLSRSLLAIGAAVLAALAAAVSQLDGDIDLVPFFVGLTVLGGVGMVATAWVAAAFIIGGLLLWERALCACSGPIPTAEATYLGLTATVYHVAGVYLGGALMAVAAFSRALSR